MQKTKTSDSMSALEDFESNELENEALDFDTAWSRFMDEQQHQQPQTPVPQDPVYTAPDSASTNLLNPQESSAFTRFLDTLLLEPSTPRTARRVDEELQKLSSLVETHHDIHNPGMADGGLNGLHSDTEISSRGGSHSIESSRAMGHKPPDTNQHAQKTYSQSQGLIPGGLNSPRSSYGSASVISESSGPHPSSESSLASSRGGFLPQSAALAGSTSPQGTIQHDSRRRSSQRMQQLHRQDHISQNQDPPRRSSQMQDDRSNQVQTQRQAQQLNAQQLKAQQLKAQQLKAQQLKAQQLKVQQLSNQQVSNQQVSNQQLISQQRTHQQLKNQQFQNQHLQNKHLQEQQLQIQQLQQIQQHLPNSHMLEQVQPGKNGGQQLPASVYDTMFQQLVAPSAQYVGYQQYHPFSSQYMPAPQLPESPGIQVNPQIQSQLASQYSQIPLQYSSNSSFGSYGQYPVYYDPQGQQQDNVFHDREPIPLTGTKRKQSGRADTSQTRINHVNSEKRRRAVIKDLFDKMCDMVPAVKNAQEGLAKSSVLQFTHDHLLSLYESNTKIRKTLEDSGVSCDSIPRTSLEAVSSEPGSTATVTNS